MLNFIVLGILPGTSLIVTLTWVLITVLILLVGSLIWFELRHSKQNASESEKTVDIDFINASTL
jgi:uncharacterized BrkB/YihY/UPF0761 family membrane protein